MGCFLGCFGGVKDPDRYERRTESISLKKKRNRVRNVQRESVPTTELTIKEPPANLVSDFLDKSTGEEQLSPSLKRRVTFNSNITTCEHVSAQESIDSLPEVHENAGKEKADDLKGTSQSHFLSEDDNSVISSVGFYPPNHRYHDARDSDDEDELYGESDFDDLNDEDKCNGYSEMIADQEVWSRSVLAPSLQSRTENPAVQAIKANARDRNDYINSVLNPIENVTQWKAAKSDSYGLMPQKENLNGNFEASCKSLSSESRFRQLSTSFKSKYDELKNENQEIAVDASLSNWLISHESMVSWMTSFDGLDIMMFGKTTSRGSIGTR